jgi:hypothetical protein
MVAGVIRPQRSFHGSSADKIFEIGGKIESLSLVDRFLVATPGAEKGKIRCYP